MSTTTFVVKYFPPTVSRINSNSNLFSEMNCTDEVNPNLKQNADLKTLVLNSYISTTSYVAPSEANLTTAQTLFEKLLETRSFSAEDVAAWSSLNLKIQRATDQSGRQYAVISEIDPATGHGHGFYAVKLGLVSISEKSQFLHAPHRPSDLYTHEIMFDMLTLTDVFGGGAWATTHRNMVDLCKEPSSYYNSFTKAVAKAVSVPTILQIHGFAKESQEVDVDVVFSSTKRVMPPEFVTLANCVKAQLNPWIVLRFPEEVDFLGGTLNINAELFYEVNAAGKFVHFETSKELRDELRINSTLKLKICECF